MAETTTLVPAQTGTDLPEPVARRGMTEAQWRTLCNSLFPGANPQSVLMVWDYCLARKLDPMKKPCHIVPMRVKDAKTQQWEWRDVVMPGIYEYRTTAQRTGEYLGHSRPEYGPMVDIEKGLTAPEWCELTIFRHTTYGAGRIEFPVRRYFREVVGLTKEGKVNDRWARAPIQMLEKCTEAAGLREAFPDEFGGEPTAEEMDDQRIVERERVIDIQPARRVSEQVPAPGPAALPSPAPSAVVIPSAQNGGDSGHSSNGVVASPSIGVIVDVIERPTGSIVKLSTGVQCGTRDAALIRAAILLKEAQTPVECITRPPADPKYAPTLTELRPQSTHGGGA